MKFRLLFSFLFLFIIAQPILYAQQKAKPPVLPGIAVLNFTNNGDKTLKPYCTSIPEAISVSMSHAEGIRVLDRANLGKVLNEMALQQSGMFEGDPTRIGKLAKADFLVVGSVSGNEQSMTVTYKAIQVSTGNILDGKIIKGNSDRIIELTASAAPSMIAILTGKNVGSISVSTNPEGCYVFIDGIEVGHSPIIEYKVVSGSHRIQVVKEGYIDAETTVDVDPNGREKWDPSLAHKKDLNRAESGIGLYWYMPFTKKIKNGMLYSPYIGQTFEHFYIGLAVGYSKLNHDQKFDFTSDIVERNYYIFNTSVHFRFIPFTSMRYFSPYVGVFLEAGRAFSFYKKSGIWESEPMGSSQKYYSMGASFGINIFPYSSLFSLFGEGRIYYSPTDIVRGEYLAPGSSQMKKEETNLSGISIGGGAKYYFN
jgi:TolB-like protein